MSELGGDALDVDVAHGGITMALDTTNGGGVALVFGVEFMEKNSLEIGVVRVKTFGIVEATSTNTTSVSALSQTTESSFVREGTTGLGVQQTFSHTREG